MISSQVKGRVSYPQNPSSRIGVCLSGTRGNVAGHPPNPSHCGRQSDDDLPGQRQGSAGFDFHRELFLGGSNLAP